MKINPNMLPNIGKSGTKKFQQVRQLYPVADKTALLVIMKVITELLDIQLKITVVKMSSPKLVVAPPKHTRGRCHWSHGPIHRDVTTNDPGYLTVLVFCSEVTMENGAIELWPKTQDVLCSRPGRFLSMELPRQIHTGNAGTVVVFDSRLLHRSQPNITENERIVLQAFLQIEGMLDLNIEI
jgi:ectoine hydroxylase-related dioxygenase (phytanoyl-CoA dioxygenase family)